MKDVYASLAEGGIAILSFRSLAPELTGLDRIIPVRSDDSRIMTTFLEYEEEHVNVHDMIYVREGVRWVLHKSVYRKLRLSAGRRSNCSSKLGSAKSLARRRTDWRPSLRGRSPAAT